VTKLLPTAPIVKFRYESDFCPLCAKELKVRSSEPFRQGVTLHIGKFIAHHTIMYCDCRPRPTTYHSEELKGLLPKYANFGYDIIEYIGRSVFQRFRCESEVVVELAGKGVYISTSTVGCLAKKFVAYLSVLHKNNEGEIRRHLQAKGGYILHVDGTSDGGSPHLISALDEISGFTLANTKKPTESKAGIASLLRDIKKRFADPVAVMTDLGKAMHGAVAKVFPGILFFVCHFHFLRDIGKDLLKKPYGQIRNSLKKHGISKKLGYRLRYFSKFIDDIEINFDKIMQLDTLPKAPDRPTMSTICCVLIYWALDGKKQGNGYGFPFDKPHFKFYQRLCTVYATVQKLEAGLSPGQPENAKMANYLIKDLHSLVENVGLKEAVEEFSEKNEVFERLRLAMRITGTDSKEGLNDAGDQDMKTIKQGVVDFKKQMVSSPMYKEDKVYQKMIGQIDKYWDKLFTDPITLKTPNGEITVQPQRTNNILEQFFRLLKRNHKRTSGSNSMEHKLRSMFADTLLVKNLDNPEYIDIVLGDKASLAECFAEIEHGHVQEEFKRAGKSENKIPAKIKHTIKKEDVPKMFLDLCENQFRKG